MKSNKKEFIIIIITCLFFVSDSSGIPSAVTYTFSGGRFGDNLLAYCHAKWISYIYNIPLLYKRFGYSEQLMMHLLEIPYDLELERTFEKVIIYTPNCIIDPYAGYLYVIPYFPESMVDFSNTKFPYLFTIDWTNPTFKSLLQKMIAPIAPLNLPQLPENYLTVAVHVRKGTSWDVPNSRTTPEKLTAAHPLLFAPDSFYINQLKRISTLFPDQAIYVHLFTDHCNPAQLAEKYRQAVACERMVFDCRTTKNYDFLYVLDDFFALTHFDCLIRTHSNFSFIASKLGNYRIEIVPHHGTVKDNATIIDEISLIIDGESLIVRE